MGNLKLGLDIGTNSIGWCVLEKRDRKYFFAEKYDKNGKIIPTKGVVIFPKGTDTQEKSKAAVRRGFRSQRRLIYRKRLRKIETLKVLDKYGLCPPFKEGELNKWRKNKKAYPENYDFYNWLKTGDKTQKTVEDKYRQPYYYRFIAATQSGLMNSKEGRYKLGRAFYHMAQRRGFKSDSENIESEDKIDNFKAAVFQLIEENTNINEFVEPFEVIFNNYKSDKKVKKLGNRIKKILTKRDVNENLKNLIIIELNKKEYLGKVAKEIKELTKDIKNSGQPTLGCYFYNNVYNKTNNYNKVKKIRGRYIDREAHYKQEFNYICDKQKIFGNLRKELHNAIFYQRPLKKQTDLIANCPFEKNKKRISISHPLFEKYRMWESLNRIKIKKENDEHLRFLTKEEKEEIIHLFQKSNDFYFVEIAKILSEGKSYRYVKDRKIEKADIEFNFEMDKTFSGSPTTDKLIKVLGKEYFNSLKFLNDANKKENRYISIEDIWHALHFEVYDNKKHKKERKTKEQARKEFAFKHLNLSEDKAEEFSKIKLKKGYGKLSRAAISKILPYLEKGEIYTYAVFKANIEKVLGRKISEKEKSKIEKIIADSINEHKYQKSLITIVNNYIASIKDEKVSLGENIYSIEVHKKDLYKEISKYYGRSLPDKNTLKKLKDDCWALFYKSFKNNRKGYNDIDFIEKYTIPDIIQKKLQNEFSKDKILMDKLYHPSAIESYPKFKQKLGNPEISSIRNPVFNRAMHQLKRLLNKLIEENVINKKTKVNIELAGEINSASYTLALKKFNNDQETLRKWVKDKIKEELNENVEPSDEQIVKYILYKEQSGRCLYTSENITPKEFLTEQMYDIEHTIPRSKINDNSFSNKTLANADFNRNYKKDILPANLKVEFNSKKAGMIHIDKELILQNRDKHLRTYTIKNKNPQFNLTIEGLKERLKNLKKAAKAAVNDENTHNNIMIDIHYYTMKLNYLTKKYKKFEITEIAQKFSNANLVDTRIITKYAQAYLNAYFDKVQVINGKLTDTMRKVWGVQKEHETKDRSNHIHHCIDAVTVACINSETARKLSEAYHKFESEYYKGNDNPRIHISEPMPDFVKTMKNLHKEVFIYHYEVDRIKSLLRKLNIKNQRNLILRGPLCNQNPYGKIKIKGEFKYVQRIPVSSLNGKNIDKIVDEKIKDKIIKLTEKKGLDSIIDSEENQMKTKSFSKEYVRKKGLEILLKENNGVLILPEFNKNKTPLLIKKIRIEHTKKIDLYKLKERRKFDIPKSGEKREYKKYFYHEKESGSNYEAVVYGELIEKCNKIKRDFRLINNFNIVKGNIPDKNPNLPVLYKIHRGDMFILFNKHYNEINWDDKEELNFRLFRMVKFGDDKRFTLERHNYANGDVDNANKVDINDLGNLKGFIVRKNASTLRAIPTKIDILGRIDIAYSKRFIENHT